MNEEELKVFVNNTMNYFDQFDGAKPTVGLPYPQDKDFRLLDYTGAIGISGGRKGCIYVTASTEMLTELVSSLGLDVSDQSFRLDAVAELANNISGNAQSAFGSDFMISVPMVITGRDHQVHLPLRLPVYMVPFTWKNHKSFLAIGIE